MLDLFSLKIQIWPIYSHKHQLSLFCSPRMRWDLAQVSHTPIRRCLSGGQSRGVALGKVQPAMVLLRGPFFRQLRFPRVSRIRHPTALEHDAGNRCTGDPRGHTTGRGVNAAVCGGSFNVGETQHLWIHQVPGAKVLLITVTAGGVAGQSVTAGVAGVLIAALLEEDRKTHQAIINNRALLKHLLRHACNLFKQQPSNHLAITSYIFLNNININIWKIHTYKK